MSHADGVKSVQMRGFHHHAFGARENCRATRSTGRRARQPLRVASWGGCETCVARAPDVGTPAELQVRRLLHEIYAIFLRIIHE